MVSSRTQVMVESRRWLVERARGDTLEIGVGSWPSLPLYRTGLELTGLDHNPRAVAQAKRTVARSGRRATVIEGDAMALEAADASFDTVVFSFSLCGVPQVRGALLEALRVLRPGGALLMADHIASTSTPLRILQRVAESATRPMFGEHFTRRPSLAARELELDIVETERLGRGMIERFHAVTR
ncbi:class I SAM-dependent methyltransferase [Demequina sp.]|uniref:class I SAM-dependent methyltransferase n=1 Tax=Demequina sp. TaxID=2050685 RepID=UPI0025C13D9C|nr:class I SAM-dependent methyltransferase [Demequina sp.]